MCFISAGTAPVFPNVAQAETRDSYLSHTKHGLLSNGFECLYFENNLKSELILSYRTQSFSI